MRYIGILIATLLFMQSGISLASTPDSEIEIMGQNIAFDIFKRAPIFDVPIAHPRSPGNFGVAANFTTYQGLDIWYLEAQLGRNIAIITATIGELELQLGVEAQAWIALGYDDWAFPLLTEDFLIAAPVSFRYGGWSGAFAYKHISAHRGDGMDRLLEETLSAKERKEFEIYDELAEKNGMDLILEESEPYSRDFLSLCVAYDYKIRKIESRVYGHLGYAHKMVPDELKRWYFGTGFEAVYPSEAFAPYYAQDVTYNQDIDTVDYSGQIGAIVAHEDEDLFTFRLAINLYIGSDRRGQMAGRKEKRLSIGFYIQ